MQIDYDHERRNDAGAYETDIGDAHACDEPDEYDNDDCDPSTSLAVERVRANVFCFWHIADSILHLRDTYDGSRLNISDCCGKRCD